jgi:GDPmannose 4,6-dehydratase
MGKVIVTGVTGQDGSYMVDYLLCNTEHMIYGGVRRLSVPNHKNIEHISNPRFKLIDLDVSDPISVSGAIEDIKPDYFINFAANSFVGTSWEMPVNHFQTNTMGVLYELEAIRKYAPNCRYYNAGSSEEFGDVQYSPQDEKHPLRPRSPYGASKASARHIVKVYRDSYKLYAVQGYLFNHESERRGEEFVTRKITKGVARIAKALKEAEHLKNNDYGFSLIPIFIGNVDAKRDWSHAADFVRGIWMMLNQEKHSIRFLDPKTRGGTHGLLLTKEIERTKYLSSKIRDYVLSSNETHSVREFITEAFSLAGIAGKWSGYEEKAIFTYNGHILVEVDPCFYRPADVELLKGDSNCVKEDLGWEPRHTFKDLIRRMVQNDMDKV